MLMERLLKPKCLKFLLTLNWANKYWIFFIWWAVPLTLDHAGWRYFHLNLTFSSVSEQQLCTHEWRPTKEKWFLQQNGFWAQRVLGLLLLPGQWPGLRYHQCGQLWQPGDQLLCLLARQHLQVRHIQTKGSFEKLIQERYCEERENAFEAGQKQTHHSCKHISKSSVCHQGSCTSWRY